MELQSKSPRWSVFNTASTTIILTFDPTYTVSATMHAVGVKGRTVLVHLMCELSPNPGIHGSHTIESPFIGHCHCRFCDMLIEWHQRGAWKSELLFLWLMYIHRKAVTATKQHIDMNVVQVNCVWQCLVVPRRGSGYIQSPLLPLCGIQCWWAPPGIHMHYTRYTLRDMLRK